MGVWLISQTLARIPCSGAWNPPAGGHHDSDDRRHRCRCSMSAISSLVRARRQYRALRLDAAEQASRIWRAPSTLSRWPIPGCWPLTSGSQMRSWKTSWPTCGLAGTPRWPDSSARRRHRYRCRVAASACGFPPADGTRVRVAVSLVKRRDWCGHRHLSDRGRGQLPSMTVRDPGFGSNR